MKRFALVTFNLAGVLWLATFMSALLAAWTFDVRWRNVAIVLGVSASALTVVTGWAWSKLDPPGE